MKKFFLFFLTVSIFLSLCACGAIPANDVAEATATPAEETVTPAPDPEPTPEPTQSPYARELTEELVLWDNVGEDTSELTDYDLFTGNNYTDGAVVTVQCDTPMYGVYIFWEQPPCNYYVNTGSTTQVGGLFGCLQEYFAFSVPMTEFNIEMTGFSMLRYIRVFGEGELPPDVHRWKAPLDKADVCVFSTHADDDVIFFGSLIADCVDRGLAVQVCYMVKHYSEQPRPHELLNALWEMGIDHYPINGGFLDYYVTDLDEAYEKFEQENVVGYVVECLRRFKPSVAVGHDPEGEYGHGAHRVFSESLQIACGLSGDSQYYYRSANNYGTWEVPKVYLHSYGADPLTIDVERPLETFGGRTAFDVANDAMLCHESQLRYETRPTLEDNKHPRYDCRKFGLYRSLVGDDTGLNDIMENIYQ